MAEESKAADHVEAIGVAMGLTVAVSSLAQELGSLKISEHRTRRLTRFLIVSLVLDIILTGVIGFLSVNDHTLNTRLAQAQHNTCVSSNAVRADDIKLWDEALVLTTRPDQTAADKQQAAQFKKFVDKTFAPVDCSKVAP